MRVFLRTEQRSILRSNGAPTDFYQREAVPGEALGRYVESIRFGRDYFATPVHERVLPDGSAHLIFELGERTSAIALGASVRPHEVRLFGTLEQVSVRLPPGAASALLTVPAAEITDRQVPLAELWGNTAVELLERLAAAPLDERPRLIAADLGKRLARDRANVDMRAARAAKVIAAQPAGTRVADWSRALGVTERRIEQLFARDVGLTPKRYARLGRFRRAVDVLCERRQEGLAEIAAVCGYYDQAHMTNEFRSIGHATPTQLAAFGFFQD